jgi:hypothetical protein
MEKIEYLMIRPDEDGECVTFFTKSELEEALNNPEDYGLQDTLFLDRLDNPVIDKPLIQSLEHAAEEYAIIIKIDSVVVPKQEVVKFTIG